MNRKMNEVKSLFPISLLVILQIGAYADSGLRQKYIDYRAYLLYEETAESTRVSRIHSGLVSQKGKRDPKRWTKIKEKYDHGDSPLYTGYGMAVLALDYKYTHNPKVLTTLGKMLDAIDRLDMRPDATLNGYLLRQDFYDECRDDVDIDSNVHPNGDDVYTCTNVQPSGDNYTGLMFGLYIGTRALEGMVDPLSIPVYDRMIELADRIGSFLMSADYDLQTGGRGEWMQSLQYPVARACSIITGQPYDAYSRGTLVEIGERHLKRAVDNAVAFIKDQARLQLADFVRCRIPSIDEFTISLPDEIRITLPPQFWKELFVNISATGFEVLQFNCSASNEGIDPSFDFDVDWLSYLKETGVANNVICDNKFICLCIPAIPHILEQQCAKVEIPPLKVSWDSKKIKIDNCQAYFWLDITSLGAFISEDTFSSIITQDRILHDRNILWVAMKVYRGDPLSVAEASLLGTLSGAPATPGIGEGEWVSDYKWQDKPFHLLNNEQREGKIRQAKEQYSTGLDFMLPYLLAYGNELKVGD